MEFVALILGIVGIAVSVFFGLRHVRRRHIVSQQQAQTTRSRQSVRLGPSVSEEDTVVQKQHDVTESEQAVDEPE